MFQPRGSRVLLQPTFISLKVGFNHLKDLRSLAIIMN
jgi:hypothetical protein